jgi:hypothetical protein
MSGGSYNYAYSALENLATDILTSRGINKSPQRLAFAKRLMLMAKAAHDIEWVDSGDYGPGDEMESIKEALGPNYEIECLVAYLEEARTTIAVLQNLIQEAESYERKIPDASAST